MSILIKALKQAERDHLARSAAAAPAGAGTAVLEVEPTPPAPAPAPPAPRSGEALSLAPVEPNAPASPGVALNERTHHDPTSGPRSEAPAASDAGPALDPGLLVDFENTAATTPAPEDKPEPAQTASPFARPLSAVLQTTDQGVSAPRTPAPAATAPVAPARPAAETARRETPAPRPAESPKAAGATGASAGTAAAPATANPEDAPTEQRKAARQLIAPAPARAPLRRIALVLGVLILMAGAVGVAYWQGLFAAIDGLSPSAQAPTPAPARSLAERMQSLPGNATSKTARPGLHPATASGGSPAKVHESNPGASVPGANPSATVAPMTPVAPDARRPDEGIHLRPPEATPDRLRALLQEAYAAAGRGDNATAARLYQQVIDLDHNNGDAWIGLGALAANSGDSAGANRAYRRALEIDPSDSIALGGLLGLQSNVDPQEAESRLRLLIVHDGAQPVLLAALGRMLARQGRWLEAQETFFRAWTADPSQPDVAFNLAVTLERIRQPLPALSFYRRALELARDHSARFNLAVAQERVAALTPKQP